MKHVWCIPGCVVLYADRNAARHEAGMQGKNWDKLLEYVLEGKGKTVMPEEFDQAVDKHKGVVIKLFAQGVPFVTCHYHTLIGDLYLVNAATATIYPTNTINPRYRKNPVSGEWWIIDGTAHYADGDIGDMNHEAYVVDHLAGTFLSYMDIETDGDRIGMMSEYEDQIVRWLVDKKGITEEQAKDDPADVAYNILVKQMVPKYFKTKDQFEQAFFIAWGSRTNIRAADYSITYDGWKRVQNNWIETWTFTKEDLKSIVDGLYDANRDELSPEDLFNIEVRATKTEYRDVPLSVLESGDYSAMREYATKHNPKRKKRSMRNPRVTVFGSLLNAKTYAKQNFLASGEPQAIVHAEFVSRSPILGKGTNTHEVMSFRDYARRPQAQQGLVIAVVGAQTQVQAAAVTGRYQNPRKYRA